MRGRAAQVTDVGRERHPPHPERPGKADARGQPGAVALAEDGAHAPEAEGGAGGEDGGEETRAAERIRFVGRIPGVAASD